MNSNLIDQLSYYGFSDKEAKIYLTCLELGSSLASTIARRSEINRWTTYSILEDFKRKWIATENIKDELKYFSVLNPEILFKRWEEQYQKMKSVLPELLALTDKLGDKPKIQFFEGLEGVKNMYGDLLTSTTEPIHAFLGLEIINKKLLEYLYKEFLPQRIRLGIKAKVISYMGEKNKEYKSIDKKALKETRLIKDDDFAIHNEINNKVAIAMFSDEEMSAVIIHSKKFHDTLLNIFNLIWKRR